MNGACISNFFGPAPLGPGEGSNGKISFKFQLQSQFQRLLCQTLCVFSQMKYTKQIRRDFHSVAWVRLRVLRGQIFFFKHGHVAYQIDGEDEQNRMQVKFSS